MKVQLHDCVSKHLAGSFDEGSPVDVFHSVHVEHEVPVETYVLVEDDERNTLVEQVLPAGSFERVKFHFLEHQMPKSVTVTLLTHDEIRTFGCDLEATVGNRANIFSDDDDNFVVELAEIVAA